MGDSETSYYEDDFEEEQGKLAKSYEAPHQQSTANSNQVKHTLGSVPTRSGGRGRQASAKENQNIQQSTEISRWYGSGGERLLAATSRVQILDMIGQLLLGELQLLRQTLSCRQSQMQRASSSVIEPKLPPLGRTQPSWQRRTTSGRGVRQQTCEGGLGSLCTLPSPAEASGGADSCHQHEFHHQFSCQAAGTQGTVITQRRNSSVGQIVSPAPKGPHLSGKEDSQIPHLVRRTEHVAYGNALKRGRLPEWQRAGIASQGEADVAEVQSGIPRYIPAQPDPSGSHTNSGVVHQVADGAVISDYQPTLGSHGAELSPKLHSLVTSIEALSQREQSQLAKVIQSIERSVGRQAPQGLQLPDQQQPNGSSVASQVTLPPTAARGDRSCVEQAEELPRLISASTGLGDPGANWPTPLSAETSSLALDPGTKSTIVESSVADSDRQTQLVATSIQPASSVAGGALAAELQQVSDDDLIEELLRRGLLPARDLGTGGSNLSRKVSDAAEVQPQSPAQMPSSILVSGNASLHATSSAQVAHGEQGGVKAVPDKAGKERPGPQGAGSPSKQPTSPQSEPAPAVGRERRHQVTLSQPYEGSNLASPTHVIPPRLLSDASTQRSTSASKRSTPQSQNRSHSTPGKTSRLAMVQDHEVGDAYSVRASGATGGMGAIDDTAQELTGLAQALAARGGSDRESEHANPADAATGVGGLIMHHVEARDLNPTKTSNNEVEGEGVSIALPGASNLGVVVGGTSVEGTQVCPGSGRRRWGPNGCEQKQADGDGDPLAGLGSVTQRRRPLSGRRATGDRAGDSSSTYQPVSPALGAAAMPILSDTPPDSLDSHTAKVALPGTPTGSSTDPHLTLDASLDSLAFFQQVHAGRLGVPAGSKSTTTSPVKNPGAARPAPRVPGAQLVRPASGPAGRLPGSLAGSPLAPKVAAATHRQRVKKVGAEDRATVGGEKQGGSCPAAEDGSPGLGRLEEQLEEQLKGLLLQSGERDDAQAWLDSTFCRQLLEEAELAADWLDGSPSQSGDGADQQEQLHAGDERIAGSDEEGALDELLQLEHSLLQTVNDLALHKMLPDAAFTIPHVPSGRVVEIVIFTTWGDPHYVGLSGIQFFDSKGAAITIASPQQQVWAVPHSLNDLDTYTCDPRTPDKLCDGVNATCSDLHTWLAPFTPGAPHVVQVDLGRHVNLGCLRLWNYNKSRIHTQRGVRDVRITLDESLVIFQGEIMRACGSVHEAPRYAESILFTTDEPALASIEAHDVAAFAAIQEEEDPRSRPESPASADVELVTEASDGALAHLAPPNLPPAAPRIVPAAPSPHAYPAPTGRILTLELCASWGDPHYVGLTALKVIGADGKPLNLPKPAFSALPADLNSVPGHSGDQRVVGNLAHVPHTGTEGWAPDPSSMWLAPSSEWISTCDQETARQLLDKFKWLNSQAEAAGQQCDSGELELQLRGFPPNYLEVDLGEDGVPVAAVVVYNYNKSVEDSYRGVKLLRVRLDAKEVTPPGGVLVFKGPGAGGFEFGQRISLAPWVGKVPSDGVVEDLAVSFATPLLPIGHVLKIHIRSTWGDSHYVGLTNVSVLGADGEAVPLQGALCRCLPHSVHESVSGMEKDVRRVDRLVDGNTACDPRNCWLAPRCPPPSATNRVIIPIPNGTIVAALLITNYAKTPARGAKLVDVFLDDNLIYQGYVRAYSKHNPTQCVLFTQEKAVVAKYETMLYTGEHHVEDVEPVALFNDGRQQLIKRTGRGGGRGGPRPSAGDEPRPATAVVC